MISGFPGGASGKEPACQHGRHRRRKFNSWSGRPPEERESNPLQSSCLKNPTDRGAWRATVHRVAKSQTRLSN